MDWNSERIVVQSLSYVRLCNPMDCSMPGSLSFTISWSLFKLMSIESMMPFKHLILCHPLSSCLQFFPASGPFPMNQLFTSGSQRTGASALVSVLPMNTQGQFTLGLTGLVSLLSKGLWRVFFSTTVQKHQLFSAELQDNYGRRLSPAQTTYFSESGATPAHTWA